MFCFSSQTQRWFTDGFSPGVSDSDSSVDEAISRAPRTRWGLAMKNPNSLIRVFVFSKRPSVIALEFGVDIPYPRSQQTRFLKEFTDLEKRASIALGVVKQ